MASTNARIRKRVAVRAIMVVVVRVKRAIWDAGDGKRKKGVQEEGRRVECRQKTLLGRLKHAHLAARSCNTTFSGVCLKLLLFF